jgi:hypothetical protein
MRQRISPAARARRALLFDTLAAIVLAVLALSLSAGLGPIGFFCLPLLIVLLLWIGIERTVLRRRHEAKLGY